MKTSYLLENEVIKLFCDWLRTNNWHVSSVATNREHGFDIRATKDDEVMLVEAKGARGNPKLTGVARKKFSVGQIKCHLGVGIVKILEIRQREPHATLVIVHPQTDEISRVVRPIAEQLGSLGILFAYVEENGAVHWQNAKSEEDKKIA